MEISIFGLGYVGAVTAACLTERGHTVIGVDPQLEKLDTINAGRAPILEPELDELLGNAKKAGRLSATDNVEQAVQASTVSIVCVGTPSLDSGGLDLRFVREVCQQIAAAVSSKGKPHLLLLRSTMLPGSTRGLVEKYFTQLCSSGLLDVVYCPEFLREGTAVADFRTPSLAVLGSENGVPNSRAESLIGGSQWQTWEGAELIKYACNYWHAVKVGFANEIGRASEHLGIDGRRIMNTVCSDKVLNISSYYMRPGNPFGGSCLPKDVSALCRFATEKGVALPLLDAVIPSNRAHADRLRSIVSNSATGKIAILGLSFKKNTDDLRNSPMVALAESLLSEGRELRIFDPNLLGRALIGSNLAQISRRLPKLSSALAPDLESCLKGANVVVVSHPVASIEEIKEQIDPSAVVVDVNGWADLEQLPNNCRGLCW